MSGRCVGWVLDDAGQRHSLWRDEEACHPHIVNRTIGGCLVSDVQALAPRSVAERKASSRARLRGEGTLEAMAEAGRKCTARRLKRRHEDPEYRERVNGWYRAYRLRRKGTAA